MSAFIPLIVVSVAAIGAIVFGIARKSSKNNQNQGTNFASDGKATDNPNSKIF